MRKLAIFLPALAAAVLLLSQVTAQPPRGGRPGDEPAKDGQKDGAASIVERMMAFDKNKDGKLTKDEITDPRLMRLFEQADTNKDGVVTKEELQALAEKLAADTGRGGRGGDGGGPGGGRGGRGGDGGGPGGRGGDGGGPGGRGGPGGGPGGRGGPGGGPPQPGQVLSQGLQERLNLTDAQKKQLAELQKEVDAKLAKILTDEQKKQLKEISERGPGGRGGRGGDGGGRGGPGGRPGGGGGPGGRPGPDEKPPE